MNLVILCISLLALQSCAASAWNFGDNVPVSLSVRHDNHHSHRRPLADAYAPKFGMHRLVTIPGLYQQAKQDALASPKNNVTKRRGFGLPRGTSIQMHFPSLNAQTAWIKLDKETAAGAPTGTRLANLMVIFTYRHGIFSDVSSVTYERRYSADGGHGDLTLEYVWREAKSVDLEAGLIAGYVTSFIAALAIMFRLSSMSRIGALTKVMVVRHREE